MNNLRSKQDTDLSTSDVVLQPKSWKQRLSRRFFSWLVIALFVGAVVIQASLTVILLRQDPSVQSEAELSTTVTAVGAASLELPTAALAVSPTPARPTTSPVSAKTPTVNLPVKSLATSPGDSIIPSPTRLPVPAGQERDTTITPSPLRDFTQEVARVEAALQSGSMATVLDYGNGIRSSSWVRFDMGGAQQEPRIQITTAYTNGDTIQNSEQIVIGNQAWHRESGSAWVSLIEQEGMWGQLQSFLPGVSVDLNPEITSDENVTTLRWYDRGRDADVTLQVDTSTRIPRRLQRVNRASGQTLTVIYSDWNTPIEIVPPLE